VGLRIAHLSFSSSGGAGGVASRLVEAQRKNGHDAYLVSHISGSLRDVPLAHPLHTTAAVIDDSLIRRRGFDAPISLVRDGLAPVGVTVLEGADVIHVHWPNGLLNVSELGKIAQGRPIVWTMHDMNSFTGVCHYSLGCSGFQRGCSACPAVTRIAQGAVSTHFERKREAVGALRNLHLVSPSLWLAEQARSSEIFLGRDVAVAPNPLPESTLSAISRDESRKSLGIHASVKTVFMMSASSILDPVKSIRNAVGAFEKAFGSDPSALLLIAGRGEISTQSTQVRLLGYVDHNTSHLALSASDYLVVPSRAENQPLAISEAQSYGVSLIARNDTGLPEHLEIDPRGFTFDDDSALSGVLAAAAQAIPTQRMRDALASKAKKRYAMETVISRYDEIYNKALGS
jgi:glycosyltransferase involved in cell wall biosynthesis